MKIATLLFTYNRSYHTEKVILALKQNIILPQKLFVFQDGLKQGDDENEWKRVNSLICGINWCDKEVIVSKYNKGLAESIVCGINYAFTEYDAVIVLEDDCVSTKNFLAFMQQCFEKYQSYKIIYSVSGYSWPIDVKIDLDDIYFCGRVSSWGWGTWKDRWCEYSRDYESIRRIKKDKVKSRRIGEWGTDLEEMLVSNMRGDIDSWAVFWALHVIEAGGYCINPAKSLIQNIGFDNTGVHCGKSKRFWTKLIEDDKKIRFALPENVFIKREVIKAFACLYGSGAGLYDVKLAKRVLIYGIGNYFRKNERQIYKEYEVLAFVDRKKKGFLNGIEIIRVNEISKYNYEYIIIMLQNVDECNQVKLQLEEKYKIEPKKILLGIQIYE